jgi:hypothetical protein
MDEIPVALIMFWKRFEDAGGKEGDLQSIKEQRLLDFVSYTQGGSKIVKIEEDGGWGS